MFTRCACQRGHCFLCGNDPCEERQARSSQARQLHPERSGGGGGDAPRGGCLPRRVSSPVAPWQAKSAQKSPLTPLGFLLFPAPKQRFPPCWLLLFPCAEMVSRPVGCWHGASAPLSGAVAQSVMIRPVLTAWPDKYSVFADLYSSQLAPDARRSHAREREGGEGLVTGRRGACHSVHMAFSSIPVHATRGKGAHLWTVRGFPSSTCRPWWAHSSVVQAG